jgi:putative hydrolase of the HAD superfamily
MKLVIFDLDDTLVNFELTRQTAHALLAELVTREGIDAVAYLHACTRVDRPLFSLFEQGKLTRQEYRLRRFSDPFGALGLPAPPALVEQLNRCFMDCVNDRPHLYDDVLPVLARLRERGIRTAVLTNGPSDGQRRKLKATGLVDIVEHVAIGEEVGVSKPLPQAFLSVVTAFSIDPAEALMVGDSPELDYDAALNAGLMARLLDRNGRHLDGGRTCVRSLQEVLPA